MRSGVPLALAAATTFGDLLRPADIARVETDAGGSGLDRLERLGVVEVDVRDDRNRRLLDDRPQRDGILLAGNRNSDQVGPGLGAALDLRERLDDVRRLRLRHCLDGYGRPSAHRHAANVYLPL